ncbi:RasGEF domain containing protein [Acanthamoeba castellanii str. Neff]|uniref:RasGEF domain containing protein n=1 Tax=Acanthamoeba castellanii (strain ATCC 30010 / Neff) TaxID=1257118 RepID=L8HFI1_ACACF|nr:RasGEF domain containing protein [Acanthamoeba castellanii str. Neff]ELR23171.1 RasGEF domain containing protein [Acanthamoeba castellanii str. Neff]
MESRHNGLLETGIICSLASRSRLRSSPRTSDLVDMVKDLGKRKKLLDFSTASLARELTMQEWEIFKRIAPREFLNQAWQRENKAIIAPNIIRMIGRFNQISYWVATEVLTKQDRKTQVKIIKKFIKTAYICYHLGNFNSMMEILSGLNNISISRLKDTWRQVPEKYKAYFEELEAVMDNQQNFHRYREQLAKREEAREPTLPYFGLFLRYFTYLDDGNPAYGPDKCINIGAMELRLEHVQKVMKYQSIPYNLSRNVHVQNFLNNLHVVEDEDKLYAMSLASQAPSNAHPDQLAPDKVTASAWVELAVVTYAVAYLVLSIVPLVDVTKTRPLPDVAYWLYGLVSPYCLVNVYGMFAGLHDKRWELVVEGSDDGQTDWRRYGFHFKPSRPSHLPLIVTPPTYWPRLDWHLWIIPLSVQKGNPLPPEWYKAFLAGLLKNTPAVLALVQHNPFTDKPPAYIRTRICEYAFAQRGKGRREGDWWVERDLGVYGGELAYDLDNLWTLGIDVTKHLDLPNKDKSGVTSYKVSM